MRAIICDNSWKEKWDNYVTSNAIDGGLLQSFAWGEFQSELEKKVYRIAVVDDSGNIEALAQIIRYQLPLNKFYFYIPRGPITNDLSSQEFKMLLKEIKKLAVKKNAIFIRMDLPIFEDNEKKIILSNLGLSYAGTVEPKSTLILDLKNDESEILSEMKSKTRYNIKVAQKHDITIEEGKEYFEDFWLLMQKTAKRDKIKVHSKKHYQKMLEVFGGEGMMKLMVADFQGKVVAGNLITVYGKWCTYLHGASDYEFRDKMAPYLLQWQSILFAKSRWCEQYDFWGADEDKWPGVTRFKIGFAPETKITQYLGAYDMPVDHLLYALYRILKKIKK